MLAVLVVGFASGILSGMFGVGGAVLTTPGIRAVGASPLEAVGSTLPAILPGAISGAWRYSRAGLVDWHVALPSGLLGSGFAVAGAELSDHVNAHYLMLLTAGLLLYTGLRSVRQHVAATAPLQQPAPTAALVLAGVGTSGPATEESVPELEAVERTSAPTVVVGLIGAAAGMLAGLLGVGGGLLLMPAYTVALRMAPKRAVATSLVAVAMFSVPAMLTHALLGHINWTFAILLTVGVVPGAQVGAKLTIGGSEARLRLLMGLFFTVLAVVYGAAELAAL
ncbi:MAG: uncharacterized protein QOI95_2049 [Acidimicrobiaceae bacterium]